MTNESGASVCECGDELEEWMTVEPDVNIAKSVLYVCGDYDPTEIREDTAYPDQHLRLFGPYYEPQTCMKEAHKRAPTRGTGRHG